MITGNDLLECGFTKCEGSSEMYAYVDSTNNHWRLYMYVYLYGDFTKVTYVDFTEYPAKEKSTLVDDIEEIKNIISNFDLCIDKYKEVYEEINNRGISILNIVKQ